MRFIVMARKAALRGKWKPGSPERRQDRETQVSFRRNPVIGWEYHSSIAPAAQRSGKAGMILGTNPKDYKRGFLAPQGRGPNDQKSPMLKLLTGKTRVPVIGQAFGVPVFKGRRAEERIGKPKAPTKKKKK